jgi:hypothetical protein
MKLATEWHQALSIIAKIIRYLLEKLFDNYRRYATQRTVQRSGLPTFCNPALLVALNVSGKVRKYETNVLFESFAEWLLWCNSNDTYSGVTDFFPKFCHRNDNINNTDCVCCNGKLEAYIIIITNVMIYIASIVSVPVLWSGDSAILEPNLVAKKKHKKLLVLCDR